MNDDVARFRDIAQERWESLENGNSITANACFEELLKISENLKLKDRIIELVILLDDPYDGVRLEAAAKLLPVNKDKALDALLDIANKKGIVAFTAKQTLKHGK